MEVSLIYDSSCVTNFLLTASIDLITIL
jgi:outer membrane protein assembly factor BamB